jgi:hypothetical protein
LELRWPGTGLVTHLGVVERNLEYESAVDLLTEIEAGTRSCQLLPWIPLMAGGDSAELVDRWKVATEAEPTSRRRGEFARVAKVFAERVGQKAVWYEKLEGWNVEESPVVNEWIAEAEGHMLLELAAQRFGPAPAEAEKAIQTIQDRKRVERMMRRLLVATGWPDLLATP